MFPNVNETGVGEEAVDETQHTIVHVVCESPDQCPESVMLFNFYNNQK